MKQNKQEIKFQDLEDAKKLKDNEFLQNRIQYRAVLLYSFVYTRLLYNACVFFASLVVFIFSVAISEPISAGFSFVSMMLTLYVLYLSNAWIVEEAINEHDYGIETSYKATFVDINIIVWLFVSVVYLLHFRI